MAYDTQKALERLIFALQEFHAAATSARDPEEPAVLAASDALADAYTVFDDAMYTQFGVDTPLDTYDEYDDEDEDDDDLDDEDDLDYFDDEDPDDDEDDYDFGDFDDDEDED